MASSTIKEPQSILTLIDIQVIRADQTKPPLPFQFSDLLPNQVDDMDRLAEGDWINGSAISSSQFTLLRQHLMEEGVLEKGDIIWLCPLPLDKLRKLESPQSNESRLIIFNIFLHHRPYHGQAFP